MSQESYDAAIRIGKRTFITSAAILLLLMIAAGVLTRLIPPGVYQRVTQDGITAIVPGSFAFTEQSPPCRSGVGSRPLRRCFGAQTGPW